MILKNKLFLDQGETVTAIKLRDRYLGKDETCRMLLETFQDHNEQLEKLIGIDFAPNTLVRYKTTLNHITNYIAKEYKAKDIPLKKVDNIFINRLEDYLKTTQKCGHNTTFKYVSNLKKIVRIAYTNGWIDKDPFIHYKTKYKTVDREFLLEHEIQAMIEKDFRIERLNQVRDIFIFCCYTGLAYIDVKTLTNNNIVLGIDGEHWIKAKRTKTNSLTNIPLLPSAYDILLK